jgi:hypothetical protein
MLFDSRPWPRMAIPSWSRIRPRLPSAATTYRARTTRSEPAPSRGRGGSARARLDVVDGTVRVVLLLPLAPDRLLEPGRPEDLDRAELEVAGARMDRGARVPFDRQAADAVEAQEQRSRETDQAPADDRDVSVLGAHPTLSTSSR